MHIQGLVVDPHVGYVQVDLLRNLEEPMALLRVVEEPREFPSLENSNGASPAFEKLDIVTTQASIHFCIGPS